MLSWPEAGGGGIAEAGRIGGEGIDEPEAWLRACWLDGRISRDDDWGIAGAAMAAACWAACVAEALREAARE